jgi:hypothetical protein
MRATIANLLQGKRAGCPIFCQPPFHYFFSSNLQSGKSRFNRFFGAGPAKKQLEIHFLDLNHKVCRTASKRSPVKALNAEYCYLYAADTFVKSRA